jgi:hypothetical protein
MLKKTLLVKLIKLLLATKIQVTISMENFHLIYNKLDHLDKIPVLQPILKHSIGEEMIRFKKVLQFQELMMDGLLPIIPIGL